MVASSIQIDFAFDSYPRADVAKPEANKPRLETETTSSNASRRLANFGAGGACFIARNRSSIARNWKMGVVGVDGRIAFSG